MRKHKILSILPEDEGNIRPGVKRVRRPGRDLKREMEQVLQLFRRLDAEGKSDEEIAETFGVPVAVVKEARYRG